MTDAFDRNGRLVVIPVFLTGSVGTHRFQFAVDTAATRTGVSGLVLEQLGYRPEQATRPLQVRTGSGGTRAGLLSVARVEALGRTLADHAVVWQAIPPASRIDGLLGLDFFRGQVLTLDFARGRVSLRPPRPWWRVWR